MVRIISKNGLLTLATNRRMINDSFAVYTYRSYPISNTKPNAIAGQEPTAKLTPLPNPRLEGLRGPAPKSSSNEGGFTASL
jgi:hypothetical protein